MCVPDDAAKGPMVRKIVQMRTIVLGDPDNEYPLVLCDDGTVWYYEFDDGIWTRLQDIPQWPTS